MHVSCSDSQLITLNCGYHMEKNIAHIPMCLKNKHQLLCEESTPNLEPKLTVFYYDISRISKHPLKFLFEMKNLSGSFLCCLNSISPNLAQ
jgi:hypothetical protein